MPTPNVQEGLRRSRSCAQVRLYSALGLLFGFTVVDRLDLGLNRLCAQIQSQKELMYNVRIQ